MFLFGCREGGAAVGAGLGEVRIYDPGANRWISSSDSTAAIKPMPVGSSGATKAVFLNGRFYVIGGKSRMGVEASAGPVNGRVDIYDPQQNIWTVGKPMPVPRQETFPVTAFGRILIAGGGDHANRGRSTTFDYYTPSPSGSLQRMTATVSAVGTP